MSDRRIELNLFDSVLAQFAPRAALRRVQARIALDQFAKRSMASGYEAAGLGRRSSAWRPRSTSADVEISAAGPRLRARMRDLVRNAPFAAEAVTAWTDYLVGAGIEPRAKTGDAKLDDRLNGLWADWAPQADADGAGGFHALISLAVRQMIEGGDCFLRRRGRRAEDGLAVPFQVQLYEAEHLDETKMTFTSLNGFKTNRGIEYDAAGRRTAYHLYKDHPGEIGVMRTLEASRVPAEFVAHLYRRDRVQQRGVPWGASVVHKLKELDDWHEAELVRKKIEACAVAFVVNPDAGDEPLTPGALDAAGSPYAVDANGTLVEQFEPGLIAYLNGGKDVRFNDPKSTGGVGEWNAVQQHAIAAGWGMPYEILTGDLSRVNYSSIRTGLIKFRQRAERYQWHVVIPIACQRIWDWFTEAAYANKLIDKPTARVEWSPPRVEEVDRTKEALADLAELRAGTTSLQQVISRKGYNWKELLDEVAEAKAYADSLGLTLEFDPSKISGAGQLQGAGATDAPPPGGE